MPTIYFYLKFFEKKEYATDFVAGKLWMNPLKFFKKLEKSDDDMFSVKMANIGGEEPPVETKSVRIDQSDYSVDLSNGVTTKQLTATTDPKGASVSWSSSDKDVATVSPKGVVTPKKAGTATITAKSGTKTSSITVTVTGQLPPDPVKDNTIYAAKPSGWG